MQHPSIHTPAEEAVGGVDVEEAEEAAEEVSAPSSSASSSSASVTAGRRLDG
jgi:hypothetical protein